MSANELMTYDERVTQLCKQFNKARHQIIEYLESLETRIK